MKAKYFMLRCVCLLLLALYGGAAWAYDFESGGLCYNILSEEDRMVEVTYYTRSNRDYVEGDLTIPSRLIYKGKTYVVTAIGNFAFNYCDALTSVEIPNSVTSIGNSAFWSCDALTSVEIPNSVTSIGNSAFFDCDALASVDIPNSVTKIGDEAFSSCYALTSVTIGSGVASIGSKVFAQCSKLATIFMDSSNQHYTLVDGILYTISKDTLITCCKGKSGGEAFVEIPNSVTAIGDGAFSSCYALTSVDIPNSVISIGNSAFESCELTSVEIPNSVTAIGSDAFGSCRRLTSVEIPSSVTSIGYGAFDMCFMLRTIYCRMPEPIECGSVCYDDVLKYATLYVPTGTKAAYEQVDPWRNFWNIEEMDFEDATAIERVTADGAEASVTTENGTIVLEGDSRLPVEVYSVGGQCLYRGTDRRITGLPNGVYVVKIGNRSQKIVL